MGRLLNKAQFYLLCAQSPPNKLLISNDALLQILSVMRIHSQMKDENI